MPSSLSSLTTVQFGRSCLYQETLTTVVVDNADGLQMAIDDYRANILKASALEVFGNLFGETVAYRPRPLMRRVNKRMTVGKAPDVPVEGAEFLFYPHEGLCVVYHRAYLPRRPYHTFRGHYPFHISITELRHLCSIEAGRNTSGTHRGDPSPSSTTIHTTSTP